MQVLQEVSQLGRTQALAVPLHFSHESLQEQLHSGAPGIHGHAVPPHDEHTSPSAKKPELHIQHWELILEQLGRSQEPALVHRAAQSTVQSQTDPVHTQVLEKQIGSSVSIAAKLK